MRIESGRRHRLDLLERLSVVLGGEGIEVATRQQYSKPQEQIVQSLFARSLPLPKTHMCLASVAVGLINNRQLRRRASPHIRPVQHCLPANDRKDEVSRMMQ